MASKRRLRRKACGRKVRYNQEGAKVAARRLAIDKETRVSEYKCPHCNCWHIGHPPVRMRQAMQSKRGEWDNRRSWQQ